MSVALGLRMTPDEFVAWELRQEGKHEYHRGEVFGMAGGTETRARIIGNAYFALRLALRGGPCTVYTDALSVRVEAEDLFTYPDLSVVCGEAAFYDERRTQLVNPTALVPTALVEVLSPSTATYDRTTKARFCRAVPSLRAYVLVNQDGPAVDVYARDGDGWRLASDRDGRIDLDPLGVSLALGDLYEGVAFPPPESRTRPAPPAGTGGAA